MKDPKKPHEKMTTKHNGLTKMQEVTYTKDFKMADNATEKNNQNQNQNKNLM